MYLEWQIWKDWCNLTLCILDCEVPTVPPCIPPTAGCMMASSIVLCCRMFTSAWWHTLLLMKVHYLYSNSSTCSIYIQINWRNIQNYVHMLVIIFIRMHNTVSFYIYSHQFNSIQCTLTYIRTLTWLHIQPYSCIHIRMAVCIYLDGSHVYTVSTSCSVNYLRHNTNLNQLVWQFQIWEARITSLLIIYYTSTEGLNQVTDYLLQSTVLDYSASYKIVIDGWL